MAKLEALGLTNFAVNMTHDWSSRVFIQLNHSNISSWCKEYLRPLFRNVAVGFLWFHEIFQENSFIQHLQLTASLFRLKLYPVNIYLFKVNSRNTRKRCEICSKLTPDRRQWQWMQCQVVFNKISLDPIPDELKDIKI